MSNKEIKPDPVEMDEDSLENSYPTGSPTRIICPECGGVMWEDRKGTLKRLQCHIGQAFSIESFLEGQAEEIEHMLWAVLRTLKERATLTRQMADEARNSNQLLLIQQFEAQAQQALQQAKLIQQVLLVDGFGGVPEVSTTDGSKE